MAAYRSSMDNAPPREQRSQDTLVGFVDLALMASARAADAVVARLSDAVQAAAPPGAAREKVG